MPRRSAPKSWPAPPDIAVHRLDPAPAELVDEDRWVAVHAGAGTAIADEALDAELRDSLLSGVDLSGRDLRRLRALDVRFEGCDLSGTNLDSAVMSRVEFVGCRMTGVVMANTELRDVVVRACRADLANWRMTSASYLVTLSTSLREADFYDARLSNCGLLDCDLRMATFRGCRLTDVDLHGSHLDDLRDAAGLAGASIGNDQIVPLAVALLAAQGIAVTDTAALEPPSD